MPTPNRPTLNLIPLYLLVLGLVLLPLAFSVSTLDATLAPRFTWLGAMLVLLGGSLFFNHSKNLTLFKFTWPFMAFLLFEAFSLFNANTPTEGVTVLLRDTGLLIFMILLIQIMQIKEAIGVVSKALVIVNAIIGSYGLYQLFTINGLVDDTRLYEVISLMGHRNLFASAMLLTLPFVAFTAWRQRGIWKWISLVVFAHTSFLIIVLESRTAWLAYLIFILSYPVWLVLEKWVSKVSITFWKSLFIAVLIIGISAFSIVYLTHFHEDRRSKEIKSELGLSTENQGNFTIDERVMLWKGTLRMIWNEPYGGVGAGNWKIMFPAYGSDIWRARQGMVQFQRPHNDYLWVLSETGIFGLIAYGSGFLILIFYGLRALNRPDMESPKKVLLRFLLSGIVTYLVVAIFSFPRERMFHQIVLYTTFGLLISLCKPIKSEKGITSKLSFLLSMITGVAIMWTGINWWQGEQTVRKINEARALGDWNGLLEHYKKVEDNVLYKIDAVSIPVSFYSGLAYLNLQKYPESQEEFAISYKLHPNNIHVINNMANIYYLQGKNDSAIMYYKEALKVSPKYLDGALNLMAAYFNTNQIEEAYDVLYKYESTFSIENPDHPTLAMYRTAILQAKKVRLQSDSDEEMDTAYLQSLSDADFEKLHFEAIEKGISIHQVLNSKTNLKGFDK